MFFRQPVSDADSRSPYAIENNPFVYTSDYDMLFKFISRNTKIPHELSVIENSSAAKKKLDNLERALLDGNWLDAIFRDPQCQLLALYLFKQGKISSADFLTINIYFYSLMQFTGEQPLKKGDEKLKVPDAEMSLLKFDDIKDKLIENLNNKYFSKHLHATFNIAQFIEAASKLSPMGQTVFKVTFPAATDNNPDLSDDETIPDQIKLILNEIADESPFMIGEDHNCYYIVSAHLAQLSLDAINPDAPVKPAPIFGQVNPKTLVQMHQKGYHPVNLYSLLVLSNPERVHGRRMGPLCILLHDFFIHGYWGNVLKKNEYQFIYEYLIPKSANTFNVNIFELETKTADYDNKLGFSRLIDLDFFSTKKNRFPDLNFFDCLDNLLCIKHAHADQLQGTFKDYLSFIHAIYNDRELIKRKYQIDIEEILNHPFFNTDGISGKETSTEEKDNKVETLDGQTLLDIFRSANERGISAVQEYEDRIDDMLLTLNQLIEDDPTNIANRLDRAYLNRKKNNYAGALTDYQYVLHHDPENARAISGIEKCKSMLPAEALSKERRFNF